MPVKRLAPDLRGDRYRVGIVLSRFNPAIGDGLLAGALRGLKEAGVIDDRVVVVTVPGALEAPLALQRLAQSGNYQALVALEQEGGVGPVADAPAGVRYGSVPRGGGRLGPWA